jgi:hypothetical protein
LRRPDDAPPRAGRQRPASVLEALTLLHRDKCEQSSERHEIDLADRGLVASCDDAVALEAKEKRSDGSRFALFGL